MRRLTTLVLLMALLATTRTASAVYCAGFDALVGRTIQPYSIVRQEQYTISGYVVLQSQTGEYGQIVDRIPYATLEEIVGQSMARYDLGHIVGSEVAFIDSILWQETMTGVQYIVGRTQGQAAIVAIDPFPGLNNIVVQDRTSGDD